MSSKMETTQSHPSAESAAPKDDVSMGSSGEEPKPDSGVPGTVSQNLEDELLWFLQMVAKLSIPSTFGYLSEARDYDPAFLQEDDPIRGAEGSKLDGGLYLGDADLSSSTYAEKLERFLRLVATEGPDFAGEDIKAPSHTVNWSKHHMPWLGVEIATKAQDRNAAHFCVHFGGAPHMRVLLPVEKDAQFEWRFGSRLSYHIPIPPRIFFLAFPEASLQDARRQLKKVYKGEADHYEVPVSHVHLPKFKPNLSKDRNILYPDTTANSTFNFLRDEIDASNFAQNLGIKLDFSQHQPLDGDARLIRPDGQSDMTIDTFELKDGLVTETGPTVVFSQPFGDERERKRHSPFHPLRLDNFVVLFSRCHSYVYCIPASSIKSAWWTGEDHVDIPREEIADYRVRIANNPDWFEQVYTSIVQPNAGCKREVDLKAAVDLDDFAVSGYVDGDDDTPFKYYNEEMKKARESSKRMPGSPWWNLDRGNQECRHRGYGIWLPLGDRERIVQAVLVGYVWDDTDKSVYDSIGKLPAELHTGDLSPSTPCLLIKMLRVSKAYTRRNGFPSFVSGLKLDKGPLPCLYLIDSVRHSDRAIPRSNILVPQEFIDFEHRNQQYTDKLASLHGGVVNSAREVMDILGPADAKDIVYHTDLRELITLPFTELMVREYRDQQDALEAFFAAHENAEKPLTWAPNLQVSATWDYVVTLRKLMQTFANEWRPNLRSTWYLNSRDEDVLEGDSEDEE